MTTTVNSDLIIHDRLVQTAYLERVQDIIEVFNAQSQGALVLRNENIQGDFSKSAFYNFAGSVGHRDVNAVTNPAVSKIAASEAISVKSPWKYGPFQATEESFKRRARTVEEFSMLIGQDLADATLVYQIAAAFAALNGAITSNAAMVTSGSVQALGKKVLTAAMRKFGDRFNRIAVFAMNAESWFDFVEGAIADKVYEEAGVVIYGGSPGTLGKPVLVSDQVPVDQLYALQPGAVELIESQAPGFRQYQVNDEENLGIGYRAEGAFNVGVMGYSWTAATKNPTTAQLASAANWTKVATSDKATAGVLIELAGS